MLWFSLLFRRDTGLYFPVPYLGLVCQRFVLWSHFILQNKAVSNRTMFFRKISLVWWIHLDSSNIHNSMNIQTVKSSPPLRIILPFHLKNNYSIKNDLKRKELEIPLFEHWFSYFCGCNFFCLNEDFRGYQIQLNQCNLLPFK